MKNNFKKSNLVLVVFGTRPEIIKLFPIIKLLIENKIQHKLVFTGQHSSLYEDVKHLIPVPDYNFKIDYKKQSLSEKLSLIISKSSDLIEKLNPKLIIIQGDTLSALGASISAFYNKIPVGHVEAGLRTYNSNSPYPEEFNRQIISKTSRFNWAPTIIAKKNLEKEGVDNILVTGNTIIDASSIFNFPITYEDKILITIHRRENFGKSIIKIFKDLNKLSKKYKNLDFILPIHPNPEVGKHKNYLDNINVINPLRYEEFLKLLSKVRFVISDSGGIQEECAVFKKKILICRNETERTEGIDCGLSKLIGNKIIENFSWAYENPKWNGNNPYGDGKASERIVYDIKRYLKV